MNTRKIFLAALLSASVLGGVAQTAQAGYLVTGTITATILNGDDSANIFGLHGASMSGQTMVLNYRYDTDLMSSSTAAGSASYSYTGTTTGIITASLTINGITLTTDGYSVGGTSFVQATNSGGGTNYVLSFLGSGNKLIGPQNFGSNGNVTATTLTTPLSGLLAAGGGMYINAGFGFDIVNFINPTETGTSTPAPEPASIAVMATSLLGLGWIRRRRAKRPA